MHCITDASVISCSHEVLEENLKFLPWEGQDNAIKNWIYSIYSSFLKYLIRKKTTLNYWQAHAKAFSDDSHTQLMDLKWCKHRGNVLLPLNNTLP